MYGHFVDSSNAACLDQHIYAVYLELTYVTNHRVRGDPVMITWTCLYSLSAMSKSSDPPAVAFARLTSIQVSGRICEYCLKPPKTGNNLLRCTACRRVSYCELRNDSLISSSTLGKLTIMPTGDSDCQHTDWKYHKKICAQLRKVNDMDRTMAKKPRYTSGEYYMQQV